MKKLLELTRSIKFLAGAVAAFAAVFSICTSPDINLFYSQYFAGMAGGVALMIQLDDDDDD